MFLNLTEKKTTKTRHYINKIRLLMKKLRSANKQGKLREAECELKVVLSNATRWSSVYLMVERYINLYDFIDQTDRDIVPYLLTPLEHAQASSILPVLKKINDVTVALQKEE